MDTMNWLFSLVCGQGRPFIVDGMALPLCQRCLGLYAGAAATLLWLLPAGLPRRGLPGGAALLVQAGLLLAALLGGLHVIDIGPRWRLACGLWTGHVVMVWLLAAAAELRGGVAPSGATARSSTVRFVAFPVALGILAFAWPWVSGLGWWFWTGAAAAGMAAVLGAMIVAAMSVAHLLYQGAARRQPDSG